MDFIRASPVAEDLARASSCGIRSVDLGFVVVIGIILACVQVRRKKSKAPASEGSRYIRIGKNLAEFDSVGGGH